MAEETEPGAPRTFAEHVSNIFDPWLEKNSSANSLMIGFMVFAVLFAIGLGFFLILPAAPPRPSSAQSASTGTTSTSALDITATFSCTGGKTIAAVFSTRQVRLSLSDGRQVSLPQALSASGARYANPDESFVFWNKGNTAFIQEGGVTTYDGCLTGQGATNS